MSSVMGKADKKAAKDAVASARMDKELGKETTEEEYERAEKKGMGAFGGINKGEEQLFEKKLSKEEKKAAMEQKKAELAAKKAAKKAAAAEGGDVEAGDAAADDAPAAGKKEAAARAAKQAAEKAATDAESGVADLTLEQQRVAAARAVTGVLASPAAARDVKIASFSVSVGGNQLVHDCDLELCQGCRYGLIGQNGSGKSNVLAAIAQRDVPLPEHIDVFHLHEEAPASEMSGVEAVIHHVKVEAERLEALSEAILEEHGPEDERLQASAEAPTAET